MRDFANPWRIFSLNDESATIICDYPKGTYKPVIPIPYCEETMHGFEYSLAGLLIAEGFVEEGLSIVRSVRDRYDGMKRNPYNEIECGSNYARSMASFALLPIFSGFEFDLPHGYIGFDPITDGDFSCLWSIANSWGNFTRENGKTVIEVCGGELALDMLGLKYLCSVKSVTVDGSAVPFEFADGVVSFGHINAHESIVIE